MIVPCTTLVQIWSHRATFKLKYHIRWNWKTSINIQICKWLSCINQSLKVLKWKVDIELFWEIYKRWCCYSWKSPLAHWFLSLASESWYHETKQDSIKSVPSNHEIKYIAYPWNNAKEVLVGKYIDIHSVTVSHLVITKTFKVLSLKITPNKATDIQIILNTRNVFVQNYNEQPLLSYV